MLSGEFFDKTKPLYVTGMGTEQVAPLLYYMIRMTRPRTVMEIGLGYTTPFILQALADNRTDFLRERDIMRNESLDPEKHSMLIPHFYYETYEPKLIAIDDFSQDGSSVHAAQEVVDALELSEYLELVKGDFRGASKQIDAAHLPFDFIWFDCGGTENSSAFFNEYWPHLNPESGYLAMHFTHRWQLHEYGGEDRASDVGMGPGDALTEIRRQLHAADIPGFEISSLVEPHKWWQGSLSLLRRMPGAERDSKAKPNPFGTHFPAFSLTG